MAGTKEPSMMSQCIQSPPLCSILCTSAAKQEKSAANMEGATIIEDLVPITLY